MTAVPYHHDEHDLDQEIVPVTTLALDPEQTGSSENGKLNPATEAANSAALEPHTYPTSNEARVTGTSDLSPTIGSELHASAPIKTDQSLIIELSSMDIFQHSPLGDVLNSLKALSLS